MSGRGSMEEEAKQREWIWEYFLKNCEDPTMIQELMNFLPFPNENLHLKKMLLLRSLSIHSSKGEIDELTLDILRGLVELGNVPAECSPPRGREDGCSFQRKRKRLDDEQNDVEVGLSSLATDHTPSSQRKGRVLPWNSGALEVSNRRKCSRTNGKKSGSVSEFVRNCVVARATWREGGPEASKLAEKIRNEGDEANSSAEGVKQIQNLTDERNASTAGTASGARELINDSLLAWSRCTFGPGHKCPREWELQMSLMVELAVMHLRGDPPNRNLFELALTKYWGDSMESTDDQLAEMAGVRDQIKTELWMVRRNPLLLDDIVKKYTKERMMLMLKTYMDKIWEELGQTFLEKVSNDVLKGIYKPGSSNCNGKTPRLGATDGEPSEDQTYNTPWIRASPGQFSKSRERGQKRFAILGLDQDDEGELIGKTPSRDDSKTRAVISNRLDQGGDEDEVDVVKDDDEASNSAGSGPGIDAVSNSPVRMGISVHGVRVADVVENEVSSDPEVADGEGQIENELDLDEADDEGNVLRGRLVMDLTECSPRCSPSSKRRASGFCDLLSQPKEGRESPGHDEKGTKDVTNANSGDLQSAEQRPSQEEAISKADTLRPTSLFRSDLNQNAVCFSPPPWVAGTSLANVLKEEAPGLTRKRSSGPIVDGPGETATAELSLGVETVSLHNGISQTPDTAAIQINLQRKLMALDAVVQDPLPTILMTSRAHCTPLETKAAALPPEVGDDDIEESPPNSPSASRCVRLPQSTGHRVSPLVGAKTSASNKSSDHKAGRRKARRWSVNEVEILKKGVGMHGKGRWKLILESNLENFQGRTEVDLKDKWRNLEKFEGVVERTEG